MMRLIAALGRTGNLSAVTVSCVTSVSVKIRWSLAHFIQSYNMQCDDSVCVTILCA